MDPVTLVVAALAAGASAGIGDTVSESIKDAYQGLKGLIKKRLEGDSKTEQTLADFEEDQDTYQKPLTKQLQASGIHNDPEIVHWAQELLKKADAAGIKIKYNVTVTGGVVGIIGDNGRIENFQA